MLVPLAQGTVFATPPSPYPTIFTPGSTAGQSLVMKSAGASVADGVRHAEVGQFWTYGFVVAANARCRLELTLEADAAPPNAQVLGPDDQPLPIATERGANSLFAIIWTVPTKWSPGARIPVMLSAK